jgi:hypothetical protein
MHIGKYDCPMLNMEAPLGTSMFQLLREKQFAIANKEVLNKKYMLNIEAQNKRLTKEQKALIKIEEPKPGANHIVCAICREQFNDYYEHIFSLKHKRQLVSWKSILMEIDAAIKQLSTKVENPERDLFFKKTVTIDLE